MLGACEIEVIMHVRVRLHLNVCVSCRMRESWQLWQKWALGTLQFYLTLYLYSSSSPSDALNIMCITLPFLSPPSFYLFLPSSIPFSPFSFFPPLCPSTPLLFPKVPGTGRDRKFRWWSTATTRVFSLHHKPATGQQNMYRH